MTLRSFDPTEHPRIPDGAGGGQFTTQGSAGGGGDKGAGGGSGKKPAATHPKSHHPAAVHHPPAGQLKSTLSYNPKTNRGAGYGQAGGDKHVHEIQRALNRLGLTDMHNKKLVDDGKLGPRTTAAIKRAQKALGLKQDGLLTPELYRRLMAMKAMPHKRSAFDEGGSRMAEPMPAPGDGMDPMHQQLCDLLGGLSDDEVQELAALAEAMHADGGM